MPWTRRCDDDGEARRALLRWREELARLYDEREPLTPQGRALRPCIRRFALPRSAFEDLIDGVAMDLHRRRYETFEELRQYCLRVASAVGLICVEIFGYRDCARATTPIELGIALQLTNILRDVAWTSHAGACTSRSRISQRFGCREEDLRAGVTSARVRELLEFQGERAQAVLSQGRAGAAGRGRARHGGGANHGGDLPRLAARPSSAPTMMCSAAGCASAARGRRSSPR